MKPCLCFLTSHSLSSILPHKFEKQFSIPYSIAESGYIHPKDISSRLGTEVT